MILILLPFLTNAAHETGHDRTDIKGRFWETTYDCDEYYGNLEAWNWNTDDDDEERRYCETFSEWQEECLSDTNLEMDCEEYEYYSSCIPTTISMKWKDPDGYKCEDYRYEGYCTEEG